MAFKMAPNSLFALLLRRPWWISAALGALVGLVAAALLPAEFKIAGALSGFPFLIIGVMAAKRQWHQPSAARLALTTQAVSAMAWPQFAALLEAAFQREGYTVQRSKAEAYDFALTRQGRSTLVAARRWKSQRAALEPLKALQAARDAAGAADAMVISLSELSDQARPFARENGITVWRAAELAQALRGQPLAPPASK